MRVLVYRLENKEGHGPFATGALYDYMDRSVHQNAYLYPNTWVAFLAHEQVRAVGMPHGCKSLRELLYWFPSKVIRLMRHDGFGIAVYEVPCSCIIYGKFQLVFDPIQAKRIVFK